MAFKAQIGLFYRGECFGFGSTLEWCMASDEATAALKIDG
jgi:hypothetical protein